VNRPHVEGNYKEQATLEAEGINAGNLVPKIRNRKKECERSALDRHSQRKETAATRLGPKMKEKNLSASPFLSC